MHAHDDFRAARLRADHQVLLRQVGVARAGGAAHEQRGEPECGGPAHQPILVRSGHPVLLPSAHARIARMITS